MCPHTTKKLVHSWYQPSKPPSVCKHHVRNYSLYLPPWLLVQSLARWLTQSNSSRRIKLSNDWYQWPPALQLSPMILYFIWRLSGAHHQAFWVPTADLRFLVCTSNAWPLGLAVFLREVRKKRTMTYGPIWSQKWWKMVPDTHLQKINGEWVVRNGPNIYLNVYTYPLIYQPGQSITINMDCW